MAFDIGKLKFKLENSTETADSITSIASWIMFYKRDMPSIVQQWSECVHNGPNKLAQIYVANEVVQQGKLKRKPEISEAFSTVLPETIGAAYTQSPPPIKDKISRVVKVWRERTIFSEDTQNAIERAIGGIAPLQSSFKDQTPPELSKFMELYKSVMMENRVEKIDEAINEIETIKSRLTSRKSSAPPAPAAVQQPPAPQQPEFEDVYTAKTAMANQTNQPANDDDNEVGYEDSEEEAASESQLQVQAQEPPAKKPKTDIDPQLASFLASFSKN